MRGDNTDENVNIEPTEIDVMFASNIGISLPVDIIESSLQE
jgi:hypothetical protein